MNNKSLIIIITLSTFILFSCEALLHYNIGKNSENINNSKNQSNQTNQSNQSNQSNQTNQSNHSNQSNQTNNKIYFYIPNWLETKYLLGTILIFSVLNGVINLIILNKID